MEKIIEILKAKNIEYEIVMIEDKKAIKFKWIKESIEKIIEIFKKQKIDLKKIQSTNFYSLYEIVGLNNLVLIEYQVKSHVQLPRFLLEYFRTGDNLYYINTASDKIIKSSAKTYNTELGYYSLPFEIYLSDNYESVIKDLIVEIVPFVNGEVTNIRLINLNKKVNKLFLMAMFRNPKQVKEVNEMSLAAKIVGGYDPEFLAAVGENMNINNIKGYTAIPIINKTKCGLVTTKSFFTNLNIDNGIECMVMLPHPKFAIALIPNKYYKEMLKKQGNQTYLLLNDEEQVLLFNKQILHYAKAQGDDVIGIKEDLEVLLK